MEEIKERLWVIDDPYISEVPEGENRMKERPYLKYYD